MLLSRREPNNIAGMNFLDHAAFALSPPAARRDNEGLPQGMGVPRGTRSRLKRDAGACNPRRIGCLKKWVVLDSNQQPSA